MDVHDKETRSYNMSCIKGKNTKPEEMVRKFLFSKGFRYRKNDKRLPGSPDIVIILFLNSDIISPPLFYYTIILHICIAFYIILFFYINKSLYNLERFILLS